MHLLESGEMYLETIWILSKNKPKVRSVDISEQMGFSKPSVSRAIGLLKKGEYIKVGQDGAITLTETGKNVAESIYERHTILTSLLMKLGVDEQTASEDACKMEHDISDKTLSAIKKFVINTPQNK